MLDTSDRIGRFGAAVARLFVGTYTEKPAASLPGGASSTGSAGVYSLSLDLESGFVSADHTVMSNANPSFLLKRGTTLVAAHEVAGKAKAAVYTAFDDGSIAHISTIADKSGAGTCHVAVHPSGRWVYGSNYESGSLSCWPLRLDGSLGPVRVAVRHEGSGPNKCRQKSSHVHSACFVGSVDEAGRFISMGGAGEGAAGTGSAATPSLAAEATATPLLAVADLGCDTVTLYACPAGEGLRAEPVLTVRTPPGFGSRMMALRPSAPWQLAVVGELANAVIIYDMRPAFEGGAFLPSEDGKDLAAGSPADKDPFREISRFDLPSCCGIRTLAAHLEFSPCGKWLYVSVRGKNVIAVYELDADARVVAQARYSCGGVSPRHFSLSPCGRYLAVANQGSDEVVVFATPKPADAGMREIARIPIPAPACVIWG